MACSRESVGIRIAATGTDERTEVSVLQVGGSEEPDGDEKRQFGGLGGMNLTLGSSFRAC